MTDAAILWHERQGQEQFHSGATWLLNVHKKDIRFIQQFLGAPRPRRGSGGCGSGAKSPSGRKVEG